MINGFSKLGKIEKINKISDLRSFNPEDWDEVKRFWHREHATQELIDGFSENVLGNFILPYSVAPNFLINSKEYIIPMVTEESSVVAAASWAARYWFDKDGFKCTVSGTKKNGQIHFLWPANLSDPNNYTTEIEECLMQSVTSVAQNMINRGGSIGDFRFKKLDTVEPYAWCLEIGFETVDSMGANFINSCLETMANALEIWIKKTFNDKSNGFLVVMCILSNYTDDCRVQASISCPVSAFDGLIDGVDGLTFAKRFVHAVDIARVDVFRAVTHNKGIFNGISSVILATGNDFRAVESVGHAWAARSGKYRSLSTAEISNDGIFLFSLDIPMAIGTIGGLTKLHPMAAFSLKLLGNPNVTELMKIVAATGLASNFAAVKALIGGGIQKGHMKLHLSNMLSALNATELEKNMAFRFFVDKTVSYLAVREYIDKIRANSELMNE